MRLQDRSEQDPADRGLQCLSGAAEGCCCGECDRLDAERLPQRVIQTGFVGREFLGDFLRSFNYPQMEDFCLYHQIVITSSHIEYVLDRMRENTTYVRNIKKYLLAALYNAPATIDSYYTSLVSHDMYGGGDRR